MRKTTKKVKRKEVRKVETKRKNLKIKRKRQNQPQKAKNSYLITNLRKK